MANTHSLDLERSNSQYAYKVDTATHSITDDISIECWVKLEQTPTQAGADMTFVSKFDPGGSARSYVFKAVNGTNKLLFAASDDGTTGAGHFVSYDSTSTISAGVWTHVAVTHDISGETCYFYINGSQEAGAKTGSIGAAMSDNASDFIVGAIESSGTPSQFVDGLIDDVRLWNDIRTEAEIQDNRNSELNGNETGLVGYWKLNNDYEDGTANNNDLTAVGSPVFSTDVPGGTTSSNFFAIL